VRHLFNHLDNPAAARVPVVSRPRACALRSCAAPNPAFPISVERHRCSAVVEVLVPGKGREGGGDQPLCLPGIACGGAVERGGREMRLVLSHFVSLRTCSKTEASRSSCSANTTRSRSTVPEPEVGTLAAPEPNAE
jgi:hypothetical protein